MHIFFYNTNIGKINIAEDDGKITYLNFWEKTIPKWYIIKETPIIKEAYKQLDLYLSGKLKDFNLPLSPAGTPFMQQVWKSLLDIPYGKTASYKDIAIAINNPKSSRAVGMANNKNPISIFIPCHRVIGSDGKLVGYWGGLDIKIKLLETEGII